MDAIKGNGVGLLNVSKIIGFSFLRGTVHLCMEKGLRLLRHCVGSAQGSEVVCVRLLRDARLHKRDYERVNTALGTVIVIAAGKLLCPPLPLCTRGHQI